MCTDNTHRQNPEHTAVSQNSFLTLSLLKLATCGCIFAVRMIDSISLFCIFYLVHHPSFPPPSPLLSSGSRYPASAGRGSLSADTMTPMYNLCGEGALWRIHATLLADVISSMPQRRGHTILLLSRCLLVFASTNTKSVFFLFSLKQAACLHTPAVSKSFSHVQMNHNDLLENSVTTCEHCANNSD